MIEPLKQAFLSLPRPPGHLIKDRPSKRCYLVPLLYGVKIPSGPELLPLFGELLPPGRINRVIRAQFGPGKAWAGSRVITPHT